MSFPKTMSNSRCPWRLERPSSPSSGQSTVSRPFEELPPAPLGKTLKRIWRAHLLSTDFREDEVHISECEVVSSYNWMEKPKGSIVVPGMPARWTPLPEPVELKEDCGTYYRDRNAAGYPKHPLEPAVQSILEIEADSTHSKSFGTVDIFGCASSLGNLLRFIRGTALPFRILVEVVGSTVHLVRRERSPFDTIPNVRGYGHTFPSAYTTWDTEVCGSSSHQRIIRYKLGGLGIFCRFEGDGYLAGDSHSSRPNSADHCLVADLSVSSREPSSDDADALTGDEPELKVSAAGNLIHQDLVFELKTRSIKRQCEENFFLEPQLPRLWLRQVPNLVLAYHSSGTFTDVRVMDVRSDVKKWENREATAVKKFVGLLQQIVEAARDGLEDGLRLEITYEEGANNICIREQEPGLPELLAPATLERWKTWLRKRDLSHFHWDDGHPDSRNSSDDEPDDDCSDFHCLSDVDPDDGYEKLDDYSDLHDPSDNEPDDGYEKLDYTACDDEYSYCGHCE
ncbi:hypothetical protein E4U42_007120 [Claviceps africana]|uniref:Geranylgeranyl pyrophosphate synthetase n=1 Tax=Claviceps africana TaxID=83212 RepID=A0A8K0J251_9HYPO|nr:hypothetical protein E4U42_007120 [Claviceps africana]